VRIATRDGFAALGWSVETVCADIFDFLAGAATTTFDVIVCNLFLHHFDDAQLARLLAHVQQSAWLFVACEPRRAKFVVRASRMLRIVGCSKVSVHDAVVSARAGFTADELGALWPRRDGWNVYESPSGLFTHRFVARRLP
jgi:SAM-dependent methyltransferase